MDGLSIRKIREDEFSAVKSFSPPEWNIDLEDIYSQHYHCDYFTPVAATFNSELVGIGLAVLNKHNSWLGVIIVKGEYRKKGIGSQITQHLIDYSKSRGINAIFLTASEMGLPIYKKIGFKHDLNYLFFKKEDIKSIDYKNQNIVPIEENDFEHIAALDYKISGEGRYDLLYNTNKGGFKHKNINNSIDGYYLPAFGKGLIVANSGQTGVELLKYRLSIDNSPVCIPETNITASEYLKSQGFLHYAAVPRMFLNENIKWDSQKVFCRGSGYLG